MLEISESTVFVQVSFIADDEPREFWTMWDARVSCALREEPEGIEVRVLPYTV